MASNPSKILRRGIGSLSLLVAVSFFASGCSVQSGAAKIEQGLSAIGHSLQKLEEDVHSKPLAENEYLIWQSSHESFKSFDSSHFRTVAKQLCPIGYVPLSRQARKDGELAASDALCDGECGYTLEWHIRCQDVPEEPFSLFGKT